MELEKLKEPFPVGDVLWRIGQAGKGRDGNVWAKVLAYIDSRCVQDRLDAVCGPENWCNAKPEVGPGGGVMQGISIKVNGEWITKWDGAENSDIEAVKGGLSDALKRAAVQWGIGRYLYDLGETWAEIVEKGKSGAHYANCKIKVDGKEEWVTFYWLAPRLPDFAIPKSKADPGPQRGPASTGQINAQTKQAVQQLAEEHGMTTGDEIGQPPTVYPAAKETLAKYTKVSELIAFADWVKQERIKKTLTPVEYADLDSKIAAKACEFPSNEKGFEAAEKLLRSLHHEMRISEGDYLQFCTKLVDAKDAKLAGAAA